VLQRIRQLRKADRGNALVEFALSVTVLLTLLFGIIDLGRALYAYDWLYNAARQTTRWAMVRGQFCNNNGINLPGCPADGTVITNYVKNTLPNGIPGLDTSGIDTGQVTVNSQCFATHNVNPNPPCAATGWIQVQVIYNFHFISPLMFNTPWQMTSTSERVVQN
jgi:Flp pilus assembly protein TadG